MYIYNHVYTYIYIYIYICIFNMYKYAVPRLRLDRVGAGAPDGIGYSTCFEMYKCLHWIQTIYVCRIQ